MDKSNTKPIRNSEHVSIDVSLENTIPSIYDENKTRQSQEDLEEFNTRFSLMEERTRLLCFSSLIEATFISLLPDSSNVLHCTLFVLCNINGCVTL
jgi:hypothetical protein